MFQYFSLQNLRLEKLKYVRECLDYVASLFIASLIYNSNSWQLQCWININLF